MAFVSYVNLMNHRKFIAGDCWYVHGEEINPDELFEKFKCNICEYEAKGRGTFMTHKKENHPQNVPTCDKFLKNERSRSDQDCWFDHQPAKGQSNTWLCQDWGQP